MDNLKPCPFCGGEAFARNFGMVDLDPEWDVVCANCGGQTFVYSTKAEAIEAWNRRVPQTEVHQYGENCTHISNCGTLNLNL